MDHHLLPHFEHERALFARALTDFANRYPKIATRLGIHGGHTDDPYLERLIQKFSLLAARLDSKLADSYPEFTEALLSLVHPHHLRSVPSCAIARFDPRAMVGQLSEPRIVRHGAMLNMSEAPVRFRSIYDVTLTPLQIRDARYTPATHAPTSVVLPANATGIISITFGSAAGSLASAICDDPVRIHLRGDRPLLAATLDALLLHATKAYVEVDQGRKWTSLSSVPFSCVGFGDTERLLPPGETHAGSAKALRYLLEYFTFPELFDFVDLDLGYVSRAAKAPEARLLSLHVVLRETPAESPAAQALASLDVDTFELFCTPLVNLFKRPAIPITLQQDLAYPVTPVPLEKRAPLDVYSIDTVHLGEPTINENAKPKTAAADDPPRVLTPAAPYQAFSHGREPDPSHVYWIAFRAHAPGRADFPVTMLSLVDLDGRPTHPKLRQVDVMTTATNHDLPSRIPIGKASGDLRLEDEPLGCPIRLITRPTPPSALPREDDAPWHLLSALSPHPTDLTRDGLPALKAILKLHASRSNAFAQRCIEAIANLDHKPASRCLSLARQSSSLVRGIEIRLALDETALRGTSLVVFTRLLARFFALYAPAGSYVQLVVHAAETGKELIRGEALQGTQPLL
ncbi:type VI secretion system baseplate subunit TssF [Burkholderia gladioli]|uniref:type VI secretion system baseplate subunit TssF n=1 Tax=Burkholderia gladioli TaxID=28095 RepID=UPI00163FBD1C|nr:type VI secretion system baseplate subunit TssF [Burkholderia gladioli]MDN7493722.1 type VI secretion system baseplate subunit TssF [Burkholderia gladioli]